MANELQSLLDYYANNPNQGKQAEVALTAAQKKQELSPATPTDYRNASLIGQTGYGAKSASQIESDLVNLSPIQRALKYGLDANAQMAQGMTSAGNEIYRQSTGERSTLAAVDDTVNDIATAVVNFGGNTAALALSPFSPEYASGMTSLLTDFNKYSQSIQSQSLNDRRAVMNDTLRLAQRDTTKAFNESDQGTVASLQRIGQDVLDSVAVGASDSQTLLSGVAQGIGSMVGIGPLGKGISALTGLSKTAGTMGAIGVQGAGGARTQAAQEAQAALADRTDLTQEQKYALENQAGLTAAAIAGPASMLMGRLVAKFEANPLARVTPRIAATNIRNGTIEEGLQSASEQLGVNQGIQSTVDPNRSMSQGVGETVGLGALYGAGTSGAMSVPAVAGGAVADTGAAIGKASKAAGSFLQKRADAVVARNEAASPVSQTRVNDAIDASVAALTPEVMAAVPEADSEYVRSLVQAVAFDPTELVQAGAPQILIEAVGDANTRVKAIQRMAALISALDPETDPDFLAAAYALNDQITRFNQVVDSDPAAWEAMPEDHPTVLAVRAVDDAVARAMQSPALIHANNKIMESMDKVPTPKTSDLTEASLSTPEGQKAVQDNVIMAELAPDRANLEMTQKILKHAQAGLLSLIPQQMRALKVAEGLLQAVQDAHASGNYMGLEGIPFVVSQDILTNDKSRKKDHDSALAYTNQVLGAMRIGRPEQAKMALENFMEFVTHMNNKVQAIGDHYKTGVHTRETGLHYQARLAPGKFGQSADKVWVNPNAPKSMRQVRAIEREADTLRKIANAMATAYPELGVPLAPRVLLPDAISSVKNKQAETAATTTPAAPSVLEVNRAKITPDPAPAEAVTETANQDAKKTKPVSRITAEQASRLSDAGLNERLNALMDKRTLKENTPEDDATFEVLNAEMSERESAAMQKEWEEALAAQAAQAEQAKQEDDVRTIPDEVVEQAVDQARDKELTAGEQDRLEKLQGTKQTEPAAKAEPEQEATPDEDAAEQAEMAQAKKSLPQVYPDLLNRPHMPNRFWSAYRVNTKNMSRLLGVPNAVEFVRNALANAAAFVKVTGSNPTVHLDEELRNSYDDLLSFAASWKQNMNQNLQDLVAGKKEKTDKDRIRKLLNGVANDKGKVNDILGFDNLRALSLTEEVVINGVRTLKYNENLVDAVTMAGLQWLLQGEKAAPESFDEREASKLLGIDESLVDPGVFRMLSGSLTNLQLVNDLAKRIKEYWGVQGKNDQLLGDSDGIAMNAALELISAMIKDGVLTRKTLKFNSTGQLYAVDDKYTGIQLKDKETPVSIVTYTVTEMDYSKPYFKYPNALDDIILSEPEQPFYLDQQRPRVPETQMRNPYVRNTPEQIKALENEAATPFRLNTVMFEFYQFLGETGITALFGPGEFNENNTNINDRLTKEGQIKSRLDAFKRLNELYRQLSARAEFLGLNPDEIDVRFNYNMSRVGRMQQLGPFGPQASKLVREALLPTESTLDLNDKNGEGYKMWVLGLAQAMGVKVHTKSLANSETELMNILSKPEMARALEGVRSWLESGQPTQEIISDLREAFGGPVPEVAMHALMDYARYQLASEADRGKFKTFLYVEADGVTNGPINAMMLMSVGAFDTNWLKVMKKGGLWIGRTDMTMNKHRESGNPEDKVDTYEQAAINMAASQSNLVSNIEMFANHKDSKKRNPVPKANYNHLAFLLNKFLPGAKLNKDGDLVIDRSAMKNPLTITIYGSGAKGIAGKVFSQMAEAIYAQFSDAMAKMEKYEGDYTFAQAMFGGTPESATEEAKKFLAAINALSAGSVYYNSKFDYWGVNEAFNFKKVTKIDPLTFTFSPSQIEAITGNILSLFVNPMRAGISNTIGSGLDMGSKLVRDATQVHSLILADAFQRALKDKIAARKAADPNYKQTDFLSPKEIKELFGPLAQLSPLVRTAVQTYFVAGSQSVLENNTRITSDFDGQARVQAFIPGPANSGVSGIPYLTIGTGDGMMMQILATMKDGVSKTMKVFDGMNIALDQVMKGSQQANQAVWESWQGNPLAAVSEAYEALMADADLDKISSQTIEDLARVFKIPAESLGANPLALIKGEMKQLGSRVKYGALTVEARHLAISKFNLSVDQMASAGAPHNHMGGIDGSQMSDEDVVAELNRLYEKEFKALIEKEKASKTSEEISKDLEGVGTELKSGVRSLPLTALRKLAKVIKIPESQMDVLNQVLRVLTPRGYKVITGTPTQLLKYIADKKMAKLSGTDAQALLEGKIGGWTHMRSKTVFVANGSSETLVHELVHAATIDTIYAHYSGQDLGEKGVAVRHAISNLEKLMAQFMQMGPNLLATDAETRTAYANAVAAIEEYNQDSGLDSATARTKALNEFMAWGLTNQKLVRAMKRTEASPLVRLAQRVVQAIKQLIWGSVEIPAVGNDMFSNLMFNSAMVMELSPSVKAAGVTGIAKHSVQQNGRIQALNQAAMALLQDIPTHIINAPGNFSQVRDAQVLSASVLNNAKAHGFYMTGPEQAAFLSTLAALATEAKFDKNVLTEAQRLYDHVTKNLKVEDLMVDPASTNPNDYALANSQFNFLVGTFGTQTDSLGRSTLLSSFLALSMVSEDLRRALSRINMPEKLVPKWGTINESLETIGLRAMDSLRNRLVNLPEGTTLTGMDALTDQLIQSAQQGESRLEMEVNKVGSMIDSANDYVVKAMESLSNKATNAANKLAKNHSNRVTKLLAQTTELVSSLVNEQRAELVSEAIMSSANRNGLNDTFRSFINDLIGRTASNAPVVDMVKWVRNRVQVTRQQYRENLPSVIVSKFSRPVTEEEMSALYRGLAKTDLVALRSTNSLQEIFDVISDDKKLAKEISALESSIAASDPKYWNQIQAKSKQLAEFMNTGKPGVGLLRNAYAISRLFSVVDQNAYSAPTPQTVKEIDKLVSLYALQGLSASDKKILKDMAKSEKSGMHFMMSYLVGQREEEVRKSAMSLAQANHYKGYVPTVQTANGNIIVAEDSQYSDLIARGYTRIDDYRGSSLDTRSKRGYYYVDVNPKSPLSQGLIQHVRQTSGGVDVTTGYTVGSMVAGVIRDPYTVKKMAAQMTKERAVENMLPVFDDSGKVVAFERSVDPAVLAPLAHDTNAARMIGVWRGRQVEEIEGQITNEVLVDRLYDMYESDLKKGRSDEYVNLFDYADDKVVMDAVRLINPQVRDMIKAKFGDEFMVSRGLLNDVLGYREASIGDAWTGVSRWSQNTLDQVRNLGMAVFGNNAYRYMVNAETTLQNYVKDARVLIVVKSVIVPAANFASNILQLVTRGVPMARIIRDIPKKVIEVNEYTKTRLRKIEAEAELMAAKDDVVKSRKLAAEIKAIDDSHRRMSIWPLIEAGEFSAISDAGITREDIMLTEGRLNAYIESLTDKLPQEVKTLGKYAVVAKDTALFQGLQKAVEYGDFLGKAMIYDHLTQTKKVSREEALAKVSEEFVNYDRLPGRTRGALENNGLMWFYNFKIRSVKVAASIIRNNPVHALLSMGAANVAGLDQIGMGTPVGDNLLAIVGDGRLGYSLGMGQGLHALSLNPWVNLMN